MNMKSSITFLALPALGVALLTGCVGVLPVPPLSTEVLAGRKIERHETSFITPGVTPRFEVERNMGSCSRECSHPPSIAYSWETPCWTMYWWIMTPYGGLDDNFPAGGWHALFVAFDDRGIVLQKDFVSLSHGTSLDDQLEGWTKRVRSTTPLPTRRAVPVRNANPKQSTEVEAKVPKSRVVRG